jgi:probable F420-dependent oxidoreductase
VQAIKAIWATWQGDGPLDFRGRFYDHTIMIPAFDPGPNPFGPPPIFTGGFGPRMTEVAGEVADGFIVHPFHTPDSLRALTLPALERGLAASGRSRADLEVVLVTMIVTWTTDEEEAKARASLADQLAFYGSTPAYVPVLACHGFDDLHPELNRLSKEGRWAEMSSLIPEELMAAVAVMGPRREIAAQLRDRVEGLGDTVSLVNNRNPDPAHFGDIVADLRAPAG